MVQSPLQSEWGGLPPWFTQIISMSMIASYLPGNNSGTTRTFTLFFMGWLLEMGRRAYKWLSERWRFQYSLSAEFSQGDPAYEWILTLLTKEQVWRSAWNFKISAKTLQRKGGVDDWEISHAHNIGNAEYIPTYLKPQLFRWRGYWIEITRSDSPSYDYRVERSVTSSTIFLTIYTRDVSVVSALVEEARKYYLETSKPHVIIHSSNSRTYSTFHWNESKRKPRRPLDSVVLEPGVLESLIEDVREFLDVEDWYRTAGIPYRRGYLLHGPPGTGKSSTIYAIAAELGLEIYSLSLASNGVDDSSLAQAVTLIPKRSIFLLEDIDCAFARGNDDHHSYTTRSSVTLSGLLNTIDGVASQEGILFFATTNHIEDLDTALIRPGRIDVKIQYHYAFKEQALSLFKRFYPISHCTPESFKEGAPDEDKQALIDSLAEEFAEQVPDRVFTTAELQGFLLICKFKPEKAVREVGKWAYNLVAEKQELKEAKEAKQQRAREKRELMEVQQLQSTLQKMKELYSKSAGKQKEEQNQTEMLLWFEKSELVTASSNLDGTAALTQESELTPDKSILPQESDSDSWVAASSASGGAYGDRRDSASPGASAEGLDDKANAVDHTSPGPHDLIGVEH